MEEEIVLVDTAAEIQELTQEEVGAVSGGLSIFSWFTTDIYGGASTPTTTIGIRG